MIEPPDYLLQFPEALPAWQKITSFLQSIDSWEPIYISGCAVAALSSTQYLECCRLHGAQASVTLETQGVAREWLVELLYLNDALPGPTDDAGRDLDLVRLCLEPAAA